MAKTKAKAKLNNPAGHTGGHPDKYAGGHHPDKYASDEISGPIKSAFKDHTWPASRKTLIAHARQNARFSKIEIERLEKIPDRRYKSVVDLTNAVKETMATNGSRPALDDIGEVRTPRDNHMAQGPMHAEPLEEQRSRISAM